MLLFSTQKVCLCAIFSRVRRAAYLYDFFFVISCMEKHNTYLFPHMGCSRDFGVSLLFKQTFSSRKMAITNSYYGRERPYTVFSVMAFLTQITLCRLWQKRAGIVINACCFLLKIYWQFPWEKIRTSTKASFNQPSHSKETEFYTPVAILALL